MLDERVMDQLKSLGYLAGAGGRSYELTGTGNDPKDARRDSATDRRGREPPERSFPKPKRIELLQQALAKDPQNPSLYYQLGGRLEKNDRYDEASQLYRTALSKGIESGRLHSRMADLLLRRGEKDAAIVEYEKAAQINPADLDSQNNLATAYLEKGRLADAERVFKWILTNDADYAAAQNGMGLVSHSEAGSSAARGYFEKAVQLDPDLVEAHMNLGLLYEMAGERPRARSSFETLSGESVSGAIRGYHSSRPAGTRDASIANGCAQPHITVLLFAQRDQFRHAIPRAASTGGGGATGTFRGVIRYCRQQVPAGCMTLARRNTGPASSRRRTRS